MPSVKDKKKPWLKFFPADWRADPRLRMCSLSARGLWADLISWMHEGEPYGHLIIEGKILDDADIAQLVGRPAGEVFSALGELRARKVFSVGEHGAIVSRRMVRDAEKAERDRKNGKGGGNPQLVGKELKGVNPPDNPPNKGEDKAQSPESRIDDDGEGQAERRRAAWQNSPGYRLAEQVANLCGARAQMALVESGWGGAAQRASLWLAHWRTTESEILASVREQLSQKRDGPPRSINYFEKGLATHIAKLRAQQTDPLPVAIVSPKTVEQVTVSQNEKPPQRSREPWQEARDRGRAARDKLAASVERDRQSGEDGGVDDVELIAACRLGL